MAKKSMIAREAKRSRIVAKYATRRAELRSQIKSKAITYEQRMALVDLLQRLPRDSSPVRRRNRCYLTGRPKGFYRKFGLCRNQLRAAAACGDIPGMVMASW